MVRGLIEQQHVRRRNYRLGNRQAFAPAAAQRVRDDFHVFEPGATQRLAQLLLALAFGDTCNHQRPSQNLACGLAFFKL